MGKKKKYIVDKQNLNLCSFCFDTDLDTTHS